MEDVGVESASRSGGLTELARCKDKNSERDLQRVVVDKYKLSLPVRRSMLEVDNPSLKIPILEMRNWLDFILQNNCWHVLVGLRQPDEKRERAILANFWDRYQKVCPDHDVFKMASAGQITLDHTCPVLLHGDEGRGRKHNAFLVVSFRGLLGRGFDKAERQKCQNKVKKPYLKQLCNYKGHSYTSRFMICGLRKADYCGDNSSVFSALMSSVANQALSVSTEGVRDPQGKQRWLMLLHITGDWPWLHKSGGLKRSFHNAQKRKGQVVAHGICHECKAGQNDVPFEQVGTKRPIWETTQYSEDPFSERTPFEVLPHVQGKLPALWVFDFFHTWHLGVAKRFIGSSLVLLSMVEPGNNVDERFGALTTRYKQWCALNHCRAYVQKLCKETVAWPSTGAFPCGIWHKGELSSVLMDFLESTTQRSFDEPLGGLLQLVREATIAINCCIRSMYKTNLWLSTAECSQISGQGLRFLRRFEELACQSKAQGLNLFEFAPKIHPLQKIFLRLHWGAVQNIGQLNPLSVSVQQCEDFIGRPSRLSRRVAGGQVAPKRVMDRYLMACYSHWLDAGLIIRPL